VGSDLVRRAGALGVLAGALVVVAAPGSASALKTRSLTTTSVDNGVLTATAKCKQGERIVSGGFSGHEESFATESRAAKGQKWIVRLLDFSLTPSLTVDAYCAKRGRVSRHKHTDDAAATPDEPSQSKAKCDSKETIISGGYKLVSATAGENSPVFSTRRTGKRAWSSAAFVDDVPGTLTTFAYCRKNAEVNVRSQQSDPIGTDEKGSVTARCHKGEKLLSGGYTTTPDSDFNNDTGPDLFYYRSSRSGPRSWTAAAHNYSDIPGQITTFVYCKS
jgi:Tfp pilus assembly major pilin PilA